MIERLEELIQILELNQKDFAERIGVSPSRITELRQKRIRTLSSDTLAKINKEFSVNINWLLTGEGEMFLPGKNSAAPPATPTVQMVNDNEAPYGVINGSVEEFPQVDTVEKISRTKWFKSLSSKQKWMVAAIADDYIDDEILRDLQLYADSRLRFKRTISEDQAKNTDMKQKGEAG